jgi:CubicO group peptidase (beta-lactamase class C family)
MVVAERPAKAETVSELKGFENFVRRLLRDWRVNGVAVAIARNDEIIHSAGYGWRDVEKKLEVTSHTLMPIGSTTKTFTTAGVSLLVDDGLVSWDTPVREYLPTFRLWDQFANERMTPRDMACHRSGLPRHDFMWYGSTAPRRELFARLQYLEPTADFRTIWQYQNLMYMTLGHLTGELSGVSWEDFVQKRIFDPLGMASSKVTSTEAKESPDLSRGYRRKKNTMVEMPLYEGFHAVAPAGSIVSSVADMSQWLLVHLNNGKLGDRQFLSEAQVRELHKPQMVIEEGKHPEMPHSSYGLGWFVQPYRGHNMIHHGGNIDGFSSMFALMPQDGIGVVVLTNMDGTPVRDILMYNVFDRFTDRKQIPWNARAKAEYKEFEAAQERGKQKAKSDRVRGTRPSHKLEAYAGRYTHPGYGSIAIELVDGALTATYNNTHMPLKHYHYDVFEMTLERFNVTFKVTFQTDTRGSVHQLLAPLEASLSERVFTRAADESMRDPAFLRAFTGAYEVMGAVMAVELKGDVLMVSIPGQPDQELEPLQGTEFAVKNVAGATITFKRDDSGKVTAAEVSTMGALLIAQKRD